jgi:hypothetical protein
VADLYRSAGCTTGTSLRWDQPAALLHQTSAVQTNCQQFHGAVGHGEPRRDVQGGGDDFSVCRSIPADAHAAGETFTWRRTAGTGGADLSIFDAEGVRHCGPTGTFPERAVTCALPPGPLTVVLNAAEAEATYDLTRQP